MSIKKYTIFIGLIVIVLTALFLIKKINDMPNLSQKMKIISLRNPKTNNSIYLKNISCGLNFSVNLLSLNNRNEINNNDFYFDAETIFFKFCHDTLLILSTSSYKLPTSNNFLFPIRCKQILDAVDFIKFHKEYRYYGYSVFPKDELFKNDK